MAVEKKPAPQSGASRGSFAPALGALYIGSLALVFIGERIVSSESDRMVVSGIGVLSAIVTTIMRFTAVRGGDEERRRAERVLAWLSLGGLVALGLYFSTTETAREMLGIARRDPATRARIEGVTTVAYAALFVITLVPLVFGELALAPMRRAALTEARRVRAAIGAGFSLSFAIVYCALFTYSAGELDYKVDYSYFRTARPGESTRKIAEGATEPIKVMAFFPDLNEVGTEVRGYLDDLAAHSPKVTVEYHDRLMVPALAKEVKVSQDGVIVLTRGNSRESLSIGTEMKTAASKLKSLDADFQKSLLKVMRAARVAYMTVGHGELNTASGEGPDRRMARKIRRLLEGQNYTIKDLGLTQGLGTEVPGDATMVIVLGPEQPLLPEEIASLARYAERGGHLLLALDPQDKVDHAPLAAIVGLTWSPVPLANDKVYVRRRHNPSDRTILVTNRFSSHASVSTLSRHSSSAPLIFPIASSLDKKEGASETIDFAVKALGETFNDDNGNFEFDKDSEKRAPYNLAAAVTRPELRDKGGSAEMRAFVIADADVLSDPLFDNEANLVFALDVLRWLGGEESFAGAIATNEDVRIEHTRDKDKKWFYGTIFGAPLLVLGVGLIVSRRTRSPKKKTTRAREKGK